MFYKKKCALSLFALATLLAVTARGVAQAPPFSPESERRAEALLKQMTLDEKVGQLNQSAGVVMPMLGSQKPDDLITQGKVGSVLWLIDVKEINRLQHLAVEKSRLHIPILFGFDVIHGYRTVFPVPLAMASSWDPSVEEAAQKYAGGRCARGGHPVDVYAHGGYCPRCALGTHRRRRRRRSVSGRGHGARAGARIPGCIARSGQRARLRQAFRRLRRGGRRTRLRLVLHSRGAFPQRLPASVPCRRTSRRGQLHERLHGPERRARHRQSLAAH